jgi:ABC-type transporter Mla maintaining outer membrane lipid asymmetry permease subunit MlaE
MSKRFVAAVIVTILATPLPDRCALASARTLETFDFTQSTGWFLSPISFSGSFTGYSPSTSEPEILMHRRP